MTCWHNDMLTRWNVHMFTCSHVGNMTCQQDYMFRCSHVDNMTCWHYDMLTRSHDKRLRCFKFETLPSHSLTRVKPRDASASKIWAQCGRNPIFQSHRMTPFPKWPKGSLWSAEKRVCVIFPPLKKKEKQKTIDNQFKTIPSTEVHFK